MMPKSLQSPSRLPEMDPAIWSRLPEELLEIVLSFLPLKTFLNLRSTCKHFKSLMFSRSFMSRHTASGSPFSSFLLLSHPQFYQEFPLYDSIVGSWRNLTLSLSLLLPVHAHYLCATSWLNLQGLWNSQPILFTFRVICIRARVIRVQDFCAMFEVLFKFCFCLRFKSPLVAKVRSFRANFRR
ncbi:F-BOX/KELCH-REPEAT PLANT PROTEIN [Salix koriyanagi]|uniref:F-BOX/KELCH-REPEAT PLANT PROTEIN n=1 Tax=Salix koriyanagi TaxID=2511006 RepID=A0A9Q0U2I1_9ROSI|nr:F-BOX/KELCH-REPEAT PLANT PROTEIN [Salix koriyanagi]